MHARDLINDGKCPVCANANNMKFPQKPEVLNLTSLEERMISPLIPFMQVRELPRGGQLSIHGNVVNVPADANSTVNVLPRPINEYKNQEFQTSGTRAMHCEIITKEK